MDIRLLTHADLAEWSALLAAAFQRPQVEMCALLDWMLAGYRMTAYGAWDGNRLAAQYSCITTSLHMPHSFQDTLAGMSVNMATHPDYRGRGLIKHVAQPVYEALAGEGVAVGVGFSNAEGVKVDRHSKGYGYRVVGQLVPYVALIPPHRRSKHCLKLNNTFCNHTQAFSWNQDCIGFSASACTVIQRFAHHPFRQYRFGIWQESDQLCGVVVDRPLRGGVSLIAAYCTTEYSLRDLLRHWLDNMKNERFIHLLASPNSSVRSALHTITPCIPLPYSRHPYYLTAKALQADTSPAFLISPNGTALVVIYFERSQTASGNYGLRILFLQLTDFDSLQPHLLLCTRHLVARIRTRQSPPAQLLDTFHAGTGNPFPAGKFSCGVDASHISQPKQLA